MILSGTRIFSVLETHIANVKLKNLTVIKFLQNNTVYPRINDIKGAFLNAMVK